LILMPSMRASYYDKAMAAKMDVEKRNFLVANALVIPTAVPKIISFTASKIEIAKGKLVTMKWSAENAKGCILIISNGLKITGRAVSDSISVTPSETLTYTLIAYDEDFNSDEKSVTIIVK
jgi:hypothetical protein